MDLSADRRAMVGDTLRSDVLGGATTGLGKVLVTCHEFNKGWETQPFIADSGIAPDVIVETT